MCLTATIIFKPSSKADLDAAIEECTGLSDYCFNGPKDAIGDWDVSSVTDMSYVFYGNAEQGNYVHGAERFNGDISKWDVSRVTNICTMFSYTKSFNGDISKWDVSRVTNMAFMFNSALASLQSRYL